MKLFDLAGTQRGCLTVLRRFQKDRKGQAHWECVCRCGATVIVTSQRLRNSVPHFCSACRGPATRTADAPLNALYAQYRFDARDRSRVFELTHEQFAEFVRKECAYCGAPPVWRTVVKNSSNYFNGIDRVDNEVGYVFSNCVSCCKVCNRAKREMPVEQFRQWVKRVYEHMYG